MALPVTIAATNNFYVSQNYYVGPFKAPNQAIYTLNWVTNTLDLNVTKATDPTSSFSTQDAANNPSSAPGGTSAWAYLSGSEIHIVVGGPDSGDTSIHYHVFDTSSDTWTITNESIESGIKDIATGNQAVSVAVRSDGDVIVLYNGDPDNDMGTAYERVDYARKEVGSWTVGVDVGGTSPAAEDRLGGVLVRGSADNMHFFWTKESTFGAAESFGVSLSGANSLSSQIQRGFQSAAAIAHNFCPGILFDDNGTLRIAAPFYNADDDNLYIWRCTEVSGALNDLAASTQIGTSDVQTANATPIACAVVDGDGQMYAMWSGGGTGGVDQDLYRDDAAPAYTSWSGETEVINTTTINRISCNVYPRDGAIKLAFVYDEAGALKYNEVSITAPTAPAMAASRFPDQNYKIGPFSV